MDFRSIDIEKLSLEEINGLIPVLSQEIEKAKQEAKRAEEESICDRVNRKFTLVWQGVKERAEEEFATNCQIEREKFILNEGMRIVLDSSIGTDYTKLFFKVVKDCLREKSFRSNQKFYRNVRDRDVVEIGKLSFAVYRLNLSKSVKEPFVSNKGIISEISLIRNTKIPSVQSAISSFSEIGLLPS